MPKADNLTTFMRRLPRNPGKPQPPAALRACPGLCRDCFHLPRSSKLKNQSYCITADIISQTDRQTDREAHDFMNFFFCYRSNHGSVGYSPTSLGRGTGSTPGLFTCDFSGTRGSGKSVSQFTSVFPCQYLSTNVPY